MARQVASLTIAAALFAGVAPSAQAQAPQELKSRNGTIKVETFATGLDHPWGSAFLPDGNLLVTERPGRLRRVDRDGTISPPIDGLPRIWSQGQGGLLDVAIDPNFGRNRLVYVSYSEAGDGGASTAVARGRLSQDMAALENVEVIFRQVPKVSGPNHFGSRLAFAPDGKLFIGLGERFKFDPAQDLSSTLGKVVRINPDGTVPKDNPFVGRDGVRPEIWSSGHRNIQGAAIDPRSGKLWVHEFGPRGGDEINLPEPGKNYGWPLVSWGRHYDGRDIPDPPTRPDLAGSVHYWNPVVSPSGMVFYQGDRFPAWKGSILMGGLSSQALLRVAVDGERVTDEERLPLGVRIRDVAEGPDGAVYLFTDESAGKILRLTPAQGN